MEASFAGSGQAVLELEAEASEVSEASEASEAHQSTDERGHSVKPCQAYLDGTISDT